MENLNNKKWEDLNLTRDEIKNIGEALQKEEFRNLLIEYVKEINDPDNRKQYEEEITQLENERGVDVKFIHPSSGYVIKTIVNGKTKAFINICSNENVGKPSSTPDVDKGHRGLNWSIPYCMAPPREDLDKKNKDCIVYDVVFHPDTLHLAKSNEAFRNLVNNTALDGIEQSFTVSLDKVNLKFPKMTFKGVKQATVVRKKIENFQQSEECPEIPNYPYPPLKANVINDVKSSLVNKSNETGLQESKPNFATPKYKIKHRSTIEMQNYTNDPLTKMSATIPDELVIEIDLPLLKNCSDACIDVTEKTLNLKSENPAKYKLNVNLPYGVDSGKGFAKFDNIKRVLTVTLPVNKSNAKLNALMDLAKEDSGVESDMNNGRSNSVSSSDDDVLENDHSVVTEDLVNLHSKTNDYCKPSKTFLNPNIYYIMPNFNCLKVKDSLTFTFQVSNVSPESVQYCFLSKLKNTGFHLTFVSVGSSFVPVHYSVYVRLSTQMENETLQVEVWDDNVIAQVKITAFDASTFEYYVGTNDKNVKKYSLSEPNVDFHKQFKPADPNQPCCHDDSLIDGKRKDENTALSTGLEAVPENEEGRFLSTNEKQTEEKIVEHQNGNKGKKLICEIRDLSISESGASSFDESSSSPIHEKIAKCRTLSESHKRESRQSRGILKIGRSLSESNVDDYATDEDGEKPKKTVRFSDSIQTQVFRMNSSILGQRKKNQRKTRNKKRAMERRLSESGGESEGEGELTVINKNIDVWLKEPESSDFSEVSEISDVSESAESDDGLKEDRKLIVPCSSKRNHKRRGKKSARKSAATAKFQFMEN